MFKQKPKYEQPAADVRWCVLEKVFTASQVVFNDAGASNEDFSLDDEQITF